MALAEVKILSFTKGKKQLEKIDVDWSRELSIVRIHVERVIGVLKLKYTILQGTLPISVIADKDDQEIDSSLLCYLCPSVVYQFFWVFLWTLLNFGKIHYSSFIGNSLPSVPFAIYLWQYK